MILRKLRVLYFSDSDLSKPGGAQQSMKVLMHALGAEYEMFIITPNGKKVMEKQIVLAKFKDFKLRNKSKLMILDMVIHILREIRNIQPDIIHLQMPASLVVVNLLLKLHLISNKINVIYTDRGIYGKYGKLTTISINSIIKKSRKVVTTTNVNMLNYKNFYNNFSDYEEKFEVIFNTAGKKFDNYDIDKREKVRETLGINNNSLVLGFCGRYSEQKNWPLAKEIIKLCDENINLLNFVVILGTDGSDIENKEATKYLQELISEVGKNKLKGFINLNNDDVAEMYYAFDIFLITSKWESFGRTAIEAMSRKNIVLGTDVDGLSEVIGSQQFLFNKAIEAVEIVKNISRDEEFRTLAIDYFFSRYHENFGYNKNIESYKQLYKDVLL